MFPTFPTKYITGEVMPPMFDTTMFLVTDRLAEYAASPSTATLLFSCVAPVTDKFPLN